MNRPHYEQGSADPRVLGTDEDRRIEGATDEIFSRAENAVSDVADRATHLARDTLESGRAAVRQSDRSTREGNSVGDGHRGTSPLTTALAVGAVGYAIATLIRGATRKRAPTPGSALPDKVPAATAAA
jgi:hypothetical protein